MNQALNALLLIKGDAFPNDEHRGNTSQGGSSSETIKKQCQYFIEIIKSMSYNTAVYGFL